MSRESLAEDAGTPGELTPVAVTTYAQVKEKLAQVRAHRAQLIAELQRRLASREPLERQLAQLESAEPHIEAMAARTVAMLASVNPVADTARAVADRVRRLDVEQVRAEESANMVHKTQLLKKAIMQLDKALEKEDWNMAANELRVTLDIEKKVTESRFAEAVVPTPERPLPPPQTIQDVRAQLLGVFEKGFHDAAQSGSNETLSKFFRLFPLIGAEREGLNLYASWVGTRIVESIADESGPRALSNLFEAMGQVVNQHEAIVHRHYGPGRMQTVIAQCLETTIDPRSLRLLTSWVKESRFATRVAAANEYTFSYLNYLGSGRGALVEKVLQSGAPYVSDVKRGGASSVASGISSTLSLDGTLLQPDSNGPSGGDAPQPAADEYNAKGIDQLLNELAAISTRWHLLRRFLLDEEEEDPTGETDVENDIDPEQDPKKHADPEKPQLQTALDSSFQRELDTLLAQVFLPMSRWYLCTRIEIAHSLDEIELNARPLVSSSLDDNLFVLKKALQRVAIAGSASILADACREFGALFDRQVGRIWRVRAEACLRDLVSLDPASREAVDLRANLAAFVNNLALGSGHLLSISTAIFNEIRESPLYIDAPAELAKISSGLLALKECAGPFNAALDMSIDQLFNQSIKQRLRTVVSSAYKDVTYQLDDAAFAEAQSKDLVFKRFVRSWDAVLGPYAEILVPAAYSRLVVLSAGLIASSWEAHLGKLKFTDLGANRFEADVTSVLGHITQQSPLSLASLRSLFSRLQQSALILNLDNDDVGDMDVDLSAAVIRNLRLLKK